MRSQRNTHYGKVVDPAAPGLLAQDSDDIRFMCGALKDLGVQLDEDWANSRLTVHGCAGKFPVSGAQLSLGNAGTAMRPLTAAVAAAGRGEFVLDGVARMRERPIQDLVDGLVQLGTLPISYHKRKCTLTGAHRSLACIAAAHRCVAEAVPKAYLWPCVCRPVCSDEHRAR
jgi:hypothetical protein